MNAYLDSRFLHAFPSEKPPTQPPQSKAIQIVSWTVEQPLQTLSFEDATWATQWCQQQGIDPNSLQYHQKNVPHERFQALENLLEIQQAGGSVGAMHPNATPDVTLPALD